jgi:hypothetical protein
VGAQGTPPQKQTFFQSAQKWLYRPKIPKDEPITEGELATFVEPEPEGVPVPDSSGSETTFVPVLQPTIQTTDPDKAAEKGNLWFFDKTLVGVKNILTRLEGKLNGLRLKTGGTRKEKRKRKRRRTQNFNGGGQEQIDRYKELIKLERSQLNVMTSIFQQYNLENGFGQDIPVEMLEKYLNGFLEVSKFLELQISALEANSLQREQTRRVVTRNLFPRTPVVGPG